MNKIKLITFALSIFGATSAMAANVLVSEQPWGQDRDITNMTNVFGANFTAYGNYAGASVGSVFNASNRFVMLEGGAASDLSLANYLSTNGASILNWVSGGGALLIQSAGWNTGFSFGPATFTYNGTSVNSCGTVTAAGAAAFTSTAPNQCGNSIAHDTISGGGLTNFMNGTDNGLSIVAGTDVGTGYIMFSGLTDSEWHFNGNSLVDNLISFTAAQADTAAVPEPGSLALIGLGLAGAFAARRRKTA